MARLRSAASYSRRWISRDKHTPTRTLGVAMEPILVTTPKALAYKALPPHFHSKTMARDDSPRLECWSSSSRRLLPRLHVSMKTCKHELADGLLGFSGGNLDGLNVLAGPAHLQRYGLRLRRFALIDGSRSGRCARTDGIRWNEGVRRQGGRFSHSRLPFAEGSCLHALRFSCSHETMLGCSSRGRRFRSPLAPWG